MAFTPLLAGSYHHLANQRTDVLAGFSIGLRLGQRFRETDYLGPVVLSDVRMYVRQVGRNLGETRLDLGLLVVQFLHPRLHGRLIHTVLDGVHDTFSTALDLLQGPEVRFHSRAPLVVLAI